MKAIIAAPPTVSEDIIKEKFLSIKDAVVSANAFREELIQTCKLKPSQTGISERRDLLCAYFKIIIGLHQAITTLVENGQYLPTLPLLRSEFEALQDGLWGLVCATDDQVHKKLTQQGFVWPGTEAELAKALDKALCVPGAGSIFYDLQQRGWKGLCDYTHVGTLAVNRALVGFQPEEPIDILRTSTTMMLLYADVMYLANQKSDPEIHAVLDKYFATKW